MLEIRVAEADSSAKIIVIGVGGYMIMREALDYRDLVTFTLYVGTFVNPMRKLASFSELFASGFALEADISKNQTHTFAKLAHLNKSGTDGEVHAAAQ